MSNELGKWLIALGLIIVLAGVVVWLFGNHPGWLDNLPGDIQIKNDNFSFYFHLHDYHQHCAEYFVYGDGEVVRESNLNLVLNYIFYGSPLEGLQNLPLIKNWTNKFFLVI